MNATCYLKLRGTLYTHMKQQIQCLYCMIKANYMTVSKKFYFFLIFVKVFTLCYDVLYFVCFLGRFWRNNLLLLRSKITNWGSLPVDWVWMDPSSKTEAVLKHCFTVSKTTYFGVSLFTKHLAESNNIRLYTA